MLPKFLSRRLRWGATVALASALITNRHDSSRWWQFVRRTARGDADLGTQNWWTEVRVRAAITFDRTLRRSPAIKDVVIDGDEVLVFMEGGVWPDVVRHMSSVQRVKGVREVRCVELADVPVEVAEGVSVTD
jgi:hypothetical protein